MLAQTSSSSGAAWIIVLILIACFAIWIWALVDAIRVPAYAYRFGSKGLWVAVILLTGVIGAIIYAAFGSPSQDQHDAPEGYIYHSVWGDEEEEENGRPFYECETCGFTTTDEQTAWEHTLQPAGSVYPGSSSAILPPPTAPQFKTCPDCAEEVRFAARKCRFCGYMFESAGVSD